MADKDFDFDNLLSGSNTSNTRTTNTTSNTDIKAELYPFSVRLDLRYVEVVKALAWYQRISQREFLEQAIDSQLTEIDPQVVDKALNKYRNEQSS